MLTTLIGMLGDPEVQSFDPATKRRIILVLLGIIGALFLLSFLASLSAKWDRKMTQVTRDMESYTVNAINEQGGKSPLHLLIAIILAVLVVMFW